MKAQGVDLDRKPNQPIVVPFHDEVIIRRGQSIHCVGKATWIIIGSEETQSPKVFYVGIIFMLR